MSSATTPRQNEGDKDEAGRGPRRSGSQPRRPGGPRTPHRAPGQKAQELASAAGPKGIGPRPCRGTKKSRMRPTQLRRKAEDATSSLGGTLKTAADKVREHTPNEGMLGRAPRSSGEHPGTGRFLPAGKEPRRDGRRLHRHDQAGIPSGR